MHISFTEQGGATFTITDADGVKVQETLPWIEVLRVGNELTAKAKFFLRNTIKLGDVSVIGRATVSDPPPKAGSDGEAAGS